MIANFKARIDRCSEHSAWWAAHVGVTITIFAVDQYGWWTRDTGPMHLSQWVKPEDCSKLL